MRREEGEKGEREKGSFFGETRFLEVTLLRRSAVGGLWSVARLRQQFIQVAVLAIGADELLPIDRS